MSPAPPTAAGVADPVVVVGGTGFLGRHLVAALASAGLDAESPAGPHTGPIVVTRRPPAEPDLLPLGCAFHPLDVERDPEGLADLIPAGSRVVNLLDLGRGVESEGGRESGSRPAAIARRFVAACARAGARRLVHVSTADVAGTGPRGLADEDAPCRPVDAYQARKLAVERTLGTEMPAGRPDLVVLRPTAVFGEGGQSLETLAASLASGRRAVNWARSCLFARRAMHLVPVETVVAAVRWALDQPGPFAGEVFLVSADGEPGNTFRPVERAMMAGLGVVDYRVPPLPLPATALELLLRATGRLRVRPTARFSAARLAGRGFVPPISFGEALARHAGRLGAGRLAARADGEA